MSGPNYNSKQQSQYLVVWLHGLGSNGQDLFSLTPYIASSLPNCSFIAPNGIEKCDMTPAGYPNSYQWFSLQIREEQVIANELKRIYPQLEHYLATKLREYKLDWSQLILIGFSQGAYLANFLALNLPHTPKAVVSLSGGVVNIDKPHNESTKFFMLHGKEDEVVPYQFTEQSAKLLKENNVQVQAHILDNLGHFINEEVMQLMTEFLIKITKNN